MSAFKAGAASVIVHLGEECFPNAESLGQHDDSYVRVIIFETDRRVALLSADMPSMFPPDIKFCKELMQEAAGVAPEDSWIMVSHIISAPHTWPVGDNQQRDTPRPKIIDEDPKIAAAAACITMAYREAYKQAVEEALADMREASVGFGAGSCLININRNMHTAEGWWQGVNHEGFADRALSVLRVNDLEGEPIAILFNYSINSSVGTGPLPDCGGKLSSSDLIGAACAYVEKDYGGNCTAMFMVGATGDQVPLYKINYLETDRSNKLRKGSFGSAGFVLVEAQGRLLGNAVVRISENITAMNHAPAIRTARRTYICECQERDPDMKNLRPARSFDYIPDGTREMTIDAIIIDDVAVVGLQPELDGITVSQIREGSPYEKTMVATFVNGNGKSMPQKESYAMYQYLAMNSPFAEGSAELTRDVAVALLEETKRQPAFI